MYTRCTEDQGGACTPGVVVAPIAVDHPRFMARKPAYRQFFREWREHRNLTQEAAAERMETTHATISRLERGKQAYTQPMLEKMADAYNCQPADLLMRDPSQPGFLWTIWDQLPVEKREAVTDIIEGVIRRTGTKG